MLRTASSSPSGVLNAVDRTNKRAPACGQNQISVVGHPFLINRGNERKMRRIETVDNDITAGDNHLKSQPFLPYMNAYAVRVVSNA